MGNILRRLFLQFFKGDASTDGSPSPAQPSPAQKIELKDLAEVISEGHDCKERYRSLYPIAEKAMQIFFDSKIHPDKLSQHLKANKSKIEKKDFFKDDLPVLYPEEGYPASSDLNIAQMYKILRNTTEIEEPTKGWGKKPHAGDQSDTDNMERIRFYYHWIKKNEPPPLEVGPYILLSTELALAIIKLSKGDLLEEIKNGGYVLWTVRTTIDEADINENQNNAYMKAAYQRFYQEMQNSVDQLTENSSEVEIRETILTIKDRLQDLNVDDMHGIERRIQRKMDTLKRFHQTTSTETQNARLTLQHAIFSRYKCETRVSLGSIILTFHFSCLDGFAAFLEDCLNGKFASLITNILCSDSNVMKCGLNPSDFRCRHEFFTNKSESGKAFLKDTAGTFCILSQKEITN